MLTNPRAYKKPKARGRRRRLVAHSHSSSTEQQQHESTAVGRSNLMRMNYPGVVGRGERVLRNLIERQLFLGNYRRSLGDDVGRRSAVVLGMAWAWAWPAGRVT